MTKILRDLRGRAGWIVLIFALLFLQAFCDLSLPEYTSRIVDTGIQQKGVEDAVPDRIRAETLETLELFMSGEEQTAVRSAYTLDDSGLYILNQTENDTRETLNNIFSEAMVLEQGLKEQGLEDFTLKAISCDGIEECRAALLKASKNVLPNNFIEGMACTGGCIGGAGCLTHGAKDKSQVDAYGREAHEKTISDAIGVLK